MFDDILAAIPFGIILAFTVGPVFFVLLETSATKGFKAAIVFDLGVVLADIIFVTVAFFSTSKLIETFKKDSNFLILGGVILFFYGVISFIKTSKSFRSIVKEYQKVKIQKNYIQLFMLILGIYILLHINLLQFFKLYIHHLISGYLKTIEWQDLYEKYLSNEWLLGNFIT